MQACEIIREIMRREGVSGKELSLRLDKSPSYISVLLAEKKSTKISTMAHVCEELGYDLIARSRDDGFEFFIDPPM